MDAAAREAQSGLEWRVTVPEGATVTVEHDDYAARAWAAWVLGCCMGARAWTSRVARKVWRIGADDPRKVVHGLKVGLALALVSVFYYTRPLYDGVGGAAMWAIMTVVVVFEYTVGGSVYKCFNRAVATASAGLLALGVHWVAGKTGEFEPYILTGSLFLLAAAATFSRFIPTVKARFDYGVTIFILTYSLVAVSGYRVDELAALAQQRLATIAIGILLCLGVAVVVCPVWAGQELHRLTTRNMEKLAKALESCCCRDEEDQGPTTSSIRCVLNSKASEEAQANLARWEPPHGRFGFRHPFAEYAKVGAAMRACASCIDALLATRTHTDKQSGLLRDACATVAARAALVLREAKRCVETMTASTRLLEFAVADMNTAVHELQADMRSLAEETMTSSSSSLLIMDAMPAFTAASLLVEISGRVEAVVDAVDALATLANFKQQVEDGDELQDDDDDNNKLKAGEAQAEMTTTKVHPLNEPDADREPADDIQGLTDHQHR
ncbi:unnamed protein product [Urochloa decumbens]|uniref:Aluminum-activated malate transporter 10 n=1 Tax=Urochloa decumbens TaxID=240449 RepID=A0ABC9EES8_9POAL